MKNMNKKAHQLMKKYSFPPYHQLEINGTRPTDIEWDKSRKRYYISQNNQIEVFSSDWKLINTLLDRKCVKPPYLAINNSSIFMLEPGPRRKLFQFDQQTLELIKEVNLSDNTHYILSLDPETLILSSRNFQKEHEYLFMMNHSLIKIGKLDITQEFPIQSITIYKKDIINILENKKLSKQKILTVSLLEGKVVSAVEVVTPLGNYTSIQAFNDQIFVGGINFIGCLDVKYKPIFFKKLLGFTITDLRILKVENQDILFGFAPVQNAILRWNLN